MCFTIVRLRSEIERILVTQRMRTNSPFSVEEYHLSTDSSPYVRFSVEKYCWSQDSNFLDNPGKTTRCIEFSVEEYDPYVVSTENVGACQSPESVTTQQ
mgnify:CR=1 FL=1